MRAALLGALLLLPASASAAQLTLRWSGAGTDEDPGVWLIRLADASPGATGTYAVDGGPSRPFSAGETHVPVPNALGPHTIAVAGPEGLTLSDTRAIVDDAPKPPLLTVTYVGEGTRLRPGVWMIMLSDSDAPSAIGTYQINAGPLRRLTPGSAVVAVPYLPGTYTITVTATDNDRDRPGDETTVTLTDTREVR